MTNSYIPKAKTGNSDSISRSLTYNGITFTAPNINNRPFYVFATKNGKTIWEKNNQIIPLDQQNPDLKNARRTGVVGSASRLSVEK